MKTIKKFESFINELNSDTIGKTIFYGKLKNTSRMRLGKFIKKLFGEKYSNVEIEELIQGFEDCIIEYETEKNQINSESFYARLMRGEYILFKEYAPKQHGGFMKITRLIPLITKNEIKNEEVRKAIEQM
jgi:hypothetical protein